MFPPTPPPQLIIKQGGQLLLLLLNIILTESVYSDKKKVEKGKQKEKVKLSLIADDVIIYVENLRWAEGSDMAQSSRCK